MNGAATNINVNSYMMVTAIDMVFILIGGPDSGVVGPLLKWLKDSVAAGQKVNQSLKKNENTLVQNSNNRRGQSPSEVYGGPWGGSSPDMLTAP
jgi:hypothetical protein